MVKNGGTGELMTEPERNAVSGQVTVHALLQCEEIRVALWAQKENVRRKSPSSLPSVVRRRKTRTALRKGMSKTSSSWPKGWATDKKGTVDG